MKQFFEIAVVWIITMGVLAVIPPDWWPLKALGAQVFGVIGVGAFVAYLMRHDEAGGFAAYFLALAVAIYGAHFLGIPRF